MHDELRTLPQEKLPRKSQLLDMVPAFFRRGKSQLCNATSESVILPDSAMKVEAMLGC
jgi:hypothetical protein